VVIDCSKKSHKAFGHGRGVDTEEDGGVLDTLFGVFLPSGCRLFALSVMLMK
jgi:hypothetical protein